MKYYVSNTAQANGDHEVHVENCTWIPNPGNRQYLGEYKACEDAVRKASEYFNQVNGCVYCSRPCHTQ